VKHSSSGVTLVEVLVAVVVLAIGVIALAGGSALVTRMIGRGKVETRAAQAAARRVETLRLVAYSTTPRCTSPDFASGGPALHGDMSESWVVAPAGKARRVRVAVSYLTTHGPRSAGLETRIEC
jgi:prepilin-type N-terminal cleavage/methylation domain-containing protein